MGKVYVRRLKAAAQVLRCQGCGTCLADPVAIISRDFHGTQGPAYLIDAVVNCTRGPKEERILITGVHIVTDVRCVTCEAVVGWRYDEAYEESQKYKEGKYVLERTCVNCETNSCCEIYTNASNIPYSDDTSLNAHNPSTSSGDHRGGASGAVGQELVGTGGAAPFITNRSSTETNSGSGMNININSITSPPQRTSTGSPFRSWHRDANPYTGSTAAGTPPRPGGGSTTSAANRARVDMEWGTLV